MHLHTKKLLLLFLILLPVIFTPRVTYADELSEITKKLEELNRAREMSIQATKPLEGTLAKLEQDLAGIRRRVGFVEEDLARKEKAIRQGEEELVQQKEVLEKRVRHFYIRSYLNLPFLVLFSKDKAADLTREIAYQQAVTAEDKRVITQIILQIKDWENKKASLEGEQTRLAKIKEEIDKQAAFFRQEIKGAKEYQEKLSGEIAALTAKQQQLLAARSGTFTTSVGEVPLADDFNASPAFSPGFSPAFAGFSFGAYTHRKGLSQYGAKGRAESGQNYQEILQAYYGKTPVNKDTGGTISVEGFGNLDFENYYLLGIAEMPSSFPKEALKSQAVAARAYAYRYKTQGQTICTSQSCQVFSKSKADNPPAEWRQAVEETRGQVIEEVVAYYSSTTGGYLTTMGWDTKCGNQGCWTGEAYEKIAGSPWFYKGWYTADYYNTSAKCGRSHPWLTHEEFADILNAWVVRKNGSEEEVSRVLPTTINSCQVGGVSGNPYSLGEMREKANTLGGAFTSASSVSITYNSGGFTDTVILQTNRGEVRIPGSEFKETFNLRAPGYISIRSPLFNIERK